MAAINALELQEFHEKRKRFYKFIKDLSADAVQSETDLIRGLEFDIYIPSLKTVIEFNGNYWHSQQLMASKYGVNARDFHYNRRERAKKIGIFLLYVWEDDWINRNSEVCEALEGYVKHQRISEILQQLVGPLDKGASEDD